MRKFYAISKTGRYGEIKIYGPIGADPWTGEGVGADQFVSDFKKLEAEVDQITIRINSPGGDIGEGLPIYNTINQCTKPTTTINDGICMSMGAIIFMAGKTRKAPATSMFVFHCASTIEWGNANELRTMADTLDSWDQVLIEGVAAATGITPEDVKTQWFDGEDHYLTGTEAKDAKIIHELIDGEADVPANIKNMSYKEIMAAYRTVKPSASLIDRFKNAFTPKQITNTDEEMNKVVASILGIPLNSIEDDIIAATQKVVADKAEFERKFNDAEQQRVAAEATIAERDTTITNLQAKLDKKPAGGLDSVETTDDPPAGDPKPEDVFTDPVNAIAKELVG